MRRDVGDPAFLERLAVWLSRQYRQEGRAVRGGLGEESEQGDDDGDAAVVEPSVRRRSRQESSDAAMGGPAVKVRVEESTSLEDDVADDVADDPGALSSTSSSVVEITRQAEAGPRRPLPSSRADRWPSSTLVPPPSGQQASRIMPPSRRRETLPTRTQNTQKTSAKNLLGPSLSSHMPAVDAPWRKGKKATRWGPFSAVHLGSYSIESYRRS